MEKESGRDIEKELECFKKEPADGLRNRRHRRHRRHRRRSD